MTTNNVPKATLQRYPVYLKALRRLQKNGVERIMSKELQVLLILNQQRFVVIFLFWEILVNKDMAMMWTNLSKFSMDSLV